MLLFGLLALIGAVLCVCPATEEAVLLEFFIATNGPSWNTNNWFTVPDHCHWTGITCSISGVITGINLDHMNLSGTIPEEISCLHYLQSLYLNHNHMTTPLPYSICQMKNLKYLQLDEAGIMGLIPSCICDLNQLMYLYMDRNSLTGRIPSCVDRMTNLHELHLDCNRLYGDIPSGFLELTHLTELRLECNPLLVCPSFVVPPGSHLIFTCGTDRLMCEEHCPIDVVPCPRMVWVRDCGWYIDF